MRKVFLDELPRKYGIGANKNKLTLDWKNSIGYKIKFIYDDIKNEIEIIDYNSKDRYLHIKYNDKKHKINISHFTECKLTNILEKKTSNFKIEIGKKLKNSQQDLTIIDRKYKTRTRKNQINNQKWYKYKCNVCNYEGWMIESHILNRKSTCACCSRKIVVEGLNNIPTTDPWMVKYFQGGEEEAKLYTSGSSKNIYPICPDCGRIKDIPIKIHTLHAQKSIGCVCGDGKSYPNKLMFNLLEQLNIKFIDEYSPEWIKPKRYDFYFEKNNKKYIIEMDGGLGHGKNVYPKSKLTKEKSLENDIYKEDIAKEHHIEIIRIDSLISNLEYIKRNIIDKLSDLLDLSQIDWIKCEKFALSNLVKEACNIKKNNPNISTELIGNILNLNKNTIRRYLKKGSELNWCSYNPNDVKLITLAKLKQSQNRKIICINDNLIFNSIKDAEIYYNIDSRRISEICSGKRNPIYKHPITGEKLKFMYYENYIKERNNKAS